MATTADDLLAEIVVAVRPRAREVAESIFCIFCRLVSGELHALADESARPGRSSPSEPT